MQSSKSGYEFIMACTDENKNDIYDYPLNLLPNQFHIFTNIFQELLYSKDWYSEKYSSLLLASQFTRMFPFKLKLNPRQGLMFLIHGLNILQ